MQKRIFLSLFIVGCLLFIGIPNAFAQEIDLLWQGDVYTPPFYKGRAQWTNEAGITILAIPHISSANGELDPTKLVYKWWKNSTVLGAVSGVGKNAITFTGSIIGRPQNIKIEILNSEGALLASTEKEFSPSAPNLLVYEDNPLYGVMFHREVGNVYVMQDKEIKLVAFPLFFSSSGRESEFLKYNWTTNTGGSESGGSVTYRTPDNTSGSSRVAVRISNEDKIMQSSEREFLLKFENVR